MMARLTVIYDVFARFNAQVAAWAETLWKDLNVAVLEEGIGELLMQVKRMPTDVKKLFLWGILEKKVKDFRDTLPLFSDLKSEALRERHWKMLMDETKIVFDMNPVTFKLQNIFDMKLHRFIEEINNIVLSATKELSIEKNLKDVRETWRTTDFTVIRYWVGSTDKGAVLGSTEEITLMLDDNALNLQSMSASPFVGPFRDQVQEWEKKLSLIGETIDVWIVVQRKWQCVILLRASY